MSTSLLYHGFGLRGYDSQRTYSRGFARYVLELRQSMTMVTVHTPVW